MAGALKAAYLGKRVLLVDKPKAAPPGGGLDAFFGGPTGLFSKALRDCGKSLDVNSLQSQGLDNDVIWLQVQNLCLRLAQNNAESQVKMLSRFKVNYLQGEAQLLPPLPDSADGTTNHQVRVAPFRTSTEPLTINTERVLVCTGSTPMMMRGTPFDGARVFDADSINGLSFLPKSVVRPAMDPPRTRGESQAR